MSQSGHHTGHRCPHCDTSGLREWHEGGICHYACIIEDGGTVTIIGGTALVRDAITSAFAMTVNGESVNDLLTQFDTTITVVIAENDERWAALVERARQDPCVIAVLPDPEIGDFVRAIRSGADGAVWEDTPTSHLANVAHAALRNDALLPQPVLNAIVTGNTGTTPDGLDATDINILRQLAEGKTLGMIAEAIHIHKRTVQRRMTSICLMLGATNPTQAVHIATKHGYL